MCKKFEEILQNRVETLEGEIVFPKDKNIFSIKTGKLYGFKSLKFNNSISNNTNEIKWFSAKLQSTNRPKKSNSCTELQWQKKIWDGRTGTDSNSPGENLWNESLSLPCIIHNKYHNHYSQIDKNNIEVEICAI